MTHNVKLTADRTCKGTDGIVIGADGLTIDLGGHKLIGDGSHTGIADFDGFDGVTVKHGTLRGWENAVLGDNNADAASLSRISATHSKTGAQWSGDGLTVRMSRFSSNSIQGLVASGDLIKVSNTTASRNATMGVQILGRSALVQKVRANANLTEGLVVVGDDAIVQSSTTSSNGHNGIMILSDAATIGGFDLENVADANGYNAGVSNGDGYGIWVSGYTTAPVGTNFARYNDSPAQCDPADLCNV